MLQPTGEWVLRLDHFPDDHVQIRLDRLSGSYVTFDLGING